MLLLLAHPNHTAPPLARVQPDVYEDEALDIDVSNISRVIITAASAAQHAALAGQHVVELQCRAFPPCFGPDLAAAADAAAAGGSGRGGAPFALRGSLAEGELGKLTRALQAHVRCWGHWGHERCCRTLLLACLMP